MLGFLRKKQKQETQAVVPSRDFSLEPFRSRAWAMDWIIQSVAQKYGFSIVRYTAVDQRTGMTCRNSTEEGRGRLMA